VSSSSAHTCLCFSVRPSCFPFMPTHMQTLARASPPLAARLTGIVAHRTRRSTPKGLPCQVVPVPLVLVAVQLPEKPHRVYRTGQLATVRHSEPWLSLANNSPPRYPSPSNQDDAGAFHRLCHRLQRSVCLHLFPPAGEHRPFSLFISRSSERIHGLP
jgi:hypothetical protein